MANLGWEDVKLPAPVFEGDTVRARTQILETRDSKSRPAVGLVKFRTTGYNQRGETVITFDRSILVFRRASLPAANGTPTG
jgi:acyl dehydratase